jgi:nitrous oxide reductase accessory protein NosL
MKKIFLIVFSLILLSGCTQKVDCTSLDPMACTEEAQCEMCPTEIYDSMMACHTAEFCNSAMDRLVE